MLLLAGARVKAPTRIGRPGVVLETAATRPVMLAFATSMPGQGGPGLARRSQEIGRMLEACGPLAPWVTSNCTRAFSLRVL
jgi:hypothetical protein